MRKVLFVLLLSFMATTSLAHLGKIDDKGGHWNYRLGVYHQHYDFETPISKGTNALGWDV